MPDALRSPVPAWIPFFDQQEVIGLLDSLEKMDEGSRVAHDQMLMLLVSAWVLHDRMRSRSTCSSIGQLGVP